MAGPSLYRKPRKTLRQALRDLLSRHKSSTNTVHPTQQVLGSGILRRSSATIPQLPNVSTVSIFSPDFGKHHTQHRQSSRPSKTLHVQDDPSNRHKQHAARLLPQPSLSNFNLSLEGCKSVMPRPVIYESVPEPYQRGASRQASVITITSMSNMDARPSRPHSSLRIRESNSSIRRPTNLETSHQCFSVSSGTIRTISTIGPQRSLRRSDKSVLEMAPCVEAGKAHSMVAHKQSPRRSLLSMVEHFKCFCVLDISQNGCPVTGTSIDLRYIFELGEQFFLNNSECEGSSMDIISGKDADNEEIVHLVLYSPLIIPSSGGHKYMLVSLIDVTDFIKDSAGYVPELDAISEESSVVDEIATPPLGTPQRRGIWSDRQYHLSADDLLGGCSLVDETADMTPSKPESEEDIWLSLAAAENRSTSIKARTSTPSRTSQTSSASSHASDPTDDALEDFMRKLQELYSQFFLLGKSPLADAYEICNVSPTTYASKDYIDGHLSHTSPEVIAYLSERLGEYEPFMANVHWGIAGTPKKLYCSPLFTGTSITWVCYLVDDQMETLW